MTCLYWIWLAMGLCADNIFIKTLSKEIKLNVKPEDLIRNRTYFADYIFHVNSNWAKSWKLGINTKELFHNILVSENIFLEVCRNINDYSSFDFDKILEFISFFLSISSQITLRYTKKRYFFYSGWKIYYFYILFFKFQCCYFWYINYTTVENAFKKKLCLYDIRRCKYIFSQCLVFPASAFCCCRCCLKILL